MSQALQEVVQIRKHIFAVPMEGPQHTTPTRAALVDPQSLPRFEDLPAETAEAVSRTLGYPFESIGLDLRVADPAQGLGLASPTAALRFWLRTRETLPDDPTLQAAAFAYLSDWWINFTSVGIHVEQLLRDGTQLHVASLNHAIWFHRPLRADRWLHFDVHSPSAEITALKGSKRGSRARRVPSPCVASAAAKVATMVSHPMPKRRCHTP